MIPLKFRLLAATLVLGLSLPALPLPAGAETVLHRGNGAEPETIDPHKSTGVPESFLEFDLFEGLVAPDGKGGHIPGSAERWDVSADGKTYTFHLRRNGKWSDGSPLTAQDYVFSWRRLVDPATASDYAYFLWPVLNGQDITLGKKKVDTLGVKAVDDYTFQVTLRGVTPYFVAMLTHHSTYPLSKASLEKHGPDFIKPGNLLSNGAYKLAESVAQSHIKMVRNLHFHAAGEVKIDTVFYYPTENLETELRRFRTGELHITYEVPTTQTQFVRDNLKDEYREAPQLGNYFYAPNLTREPWKSNQNLRLALNLAIDRDAITGKVSRQGERPAYGFVPPQAPNYQSALPDYAKWTQAERDAKARELVKAAGYGPGGMPLEVEIMYNTSENHRRVAIAIASMWQQKLGVKTVLNNQEWKVFLDTRDNKKFRDVVRHGWVGDVNDANNFLELLRSDIGPQNPSGYANPEFDRLMSEANATMDVEARADLMEQAERVMLADVAVFPIYYYASQHMVSRKVKGWTDNALDQHPTRFLSLEP